MYEKWSDDQLLYNMDLFVAQNSMVIFITLSNHTKFSMTSSLRFLKRIMKFSPRVQLIKSSMLHVKLGRWRGDEPAGAL